MKSRTLFSSALTALVLVAPVGVMTGIGVIAQASDQSAEARMKMAAVAVEKAEKALAKGRTDLAIRHAESAVAYVPTNPAYRMLLGQSYLSGGRFASAAQTFNDVVQLDPANGRAALHLALAQTALGDWVAARSTLETHATLISPTDRGLALALAGDPGTAIAILGEAARAPDADAKVRQNLALSLALAGRWAEARAVAAFDVLPGELDKRMLEWASFARPQTAADQVAALLGVTPAADQGQPVQLALVTSGPALAVTMPADEVAAEAPAPVDAAPVDIAPVAVAVAPVAPVAEPAPVETGTAAAVSDQPAIVFAPRQEVVQTIKPVANVRPARVAAPAKPVLSVGAMAAKPAAPRSFASGTFYVQLGAFDNAAVAQDAWRRMNRRHAALGKLTPHEHQVELNGTSFYRLSVGGFMRGDADALCRTIRARGDRCFVRGTTGEKVASWHKGFALAKRG